MAFNPKDYETVESRLARFWQDYPEGRVAADPVAYSETQFIVKAEVYRNATDPFPMATGLAEETVGSSPVNRTSALENCETSAIGRALANAGYATKGKRASREEMEKVQRVQERLEAPPDPEVIAGLVVAFGDCPDLDALALVAQKVATISPKLDDASRESLRAAYAEAKERIEAA